MKLNWGTGIVIVYAMFAAATMGFVVFAMDQRVELVSADYYQRALQQDQHSAATARAAALGEAFQLRMSDDGRTAMVTWTQARPVSGDGSVTLYRPSDVTADRTVAVDPDRDGRQAVSLAGLPPGRWVIEVRWRSDRVEYYAERAVTSR